MTGRAGGGDRCFPRHGNPMTQVEVLVWGTQKLPISVVPAFRVCVMFCSHFLNCKMLGVKTKKIIYIYIYSDPSACKMLFFSRLFVGWFVALAFLMRGCYVGTDSGCYVLSG